MTYADGNVRFARQLDIDAKVFSEPAITIELPQTAATDPAAIATFVLSANLAVRMFHDVSLLAPDVPVPSNPWALNRVGELVHILSELSVGKVRWNHSRRADIALGIGAPVTVSAVDSTFITFDGWKAALDIALPLRNHSGILGGLFAACYGTAQLFVIAAIRSGSRRHRIAPFEHSLLDYAANGENDDLPALVDIGKVHLVGVGAVGSATLYALAHIENIRGVLNAIDGDVVDDTNLQRYILMRRADVNSHKTEVAAKTFQDRPFKAISFSKNFVDFNRQHPDPIELMLTPIDSEAGRRRLAAYLPRHVLNAATGGTTATVSSHSFADGNACLACLYPADSSDLSTEQVIAKDLGVSAHEIATLLERNEPVDDRFVRRVAIHRGMPEHALDEHVGMHIQSFYQRAVCGQAVISVGAQTIVSPLGFVSSAAGIMLASELLKLKSPELNRFALHNYFRIDSLSAPNPSYKTLKRQRANGCICNDSDYVDVYRRRLESS